MARRDLSGAVDFSVLERTTGGDDGVSEEVLALFAEQAAIWACAEAEAGDGAGLDRVRNELDRALADVAAWRHELLLRSLKGA